MKARFLIPLAIFLVIAGFLAVGLKLDPRTVPSPFVGKLAPQFSLPTLYEPAEAIGTQDMRGEVWLLNVWASWCAACYHEHPVIVDLSRQENIDIIGLNYKDKPEPAKQWLSRLGNPYVKNAVDNDGLVGIEWGVYGVPETFVIDRKGIVRYKHIGPVTDNDVQQTIVPLIRELKKESA